MQTTGINNDMSALFNSQFYMWWLNFSISQCDPSVGMTFQSEHKKQMPFFLILVCRIYGLNCHSFNILI